MKKLVKIIDIDNMIKGFQIRWSSLAPAWQNMVRCKIKFQNAYHSFLVSQIVP